jgi:hypothetical protein
MAGKLGIVDMPLQSLLPIGLQSVDFIIGGGLDA